MVLPALCLVPPALIPATYLFNQLTFANLDGWR